MKFITENQLKGDKGEPKPMVRLSGASCLGPWGCLSGGPAGGNRLLRRGRRGSIQHQPQPVPHLPPTAQALPPFIVKYISFTQCFDFKC